MAVATHAHPRAAEPAPAVRGTEAGAPTPLAARALLVAFTACLVYACFASGATALPQESWLELALAAIATVAAGVWLYGTGIALRASPLAVAGIALLLLFAAWAAASIAYSVAPDRSWAEVNRVIAFALTALIGVFIGSSLPRAAERVGLALALAALPVALYALGGKTLPGVHIGTLINLDQAGSFNRLRAPLGYWNALALVCVTGLLPLLRLAADPSRLPWRRASALVGVFVLVLVIGLTYSRGGVLALVAGVATLTALGTERIRTLVFFGSALVASVLPLSIALGRPDLTRDIVPLAQRQDDALAVLAAVLAVGVLLALWGRALVAIENGPVFTAARGRAIGRPVAAALGALVVLGVLGSLATGSAQDAFASFKDPQGAAALTDPTRLLSSNSGNRWVWWKEAAGAWSDKPVAGWGAGSFPVTHRLYRELPLSVLQPHSVPLQWLAEDGLIGFLLAAGGLLALLAAALARVRSVPRSVSGAAPARGASAALLAVAVAWGVHSLFEWDWDIPAVTLPMLLCLGVVAARPARGGGGRPLTARGLVMTGVTVGFVLFTVSALLPAIAKTKTSSALEAVGNDKVSQAQLADAAAQAELAARLNPLSPDPLIAASDIAERRKRPDQARAYLLRAVRRQPYDVDAWTHLIRTEFLRGDRAAVRRASVKALDLDPISAATFGLAYRARQNSVLPSESTSATGSPLPTQVPITAP